MLIETHTTEEYVSVLFLEITIKKKEEKDFAPNTKLSFSLNININMDNELNGPKQIHVKQNKFHSNFLTILSSRL